MGRRCRHVQCPPAPATPPPPQDDRPDGLKRGRKDYSSGRPSRPQDGWNDHRGHPPQRPSEAAEDLHQASVLCLSPEQNVCTKGKEGTGWRWDTRWSVCLPARKLQPIAHVRSPTPIYSPPRFFCGRVAGYVEQQDMHSTVVTVKEVGTWAKTLRRKLAFIQ